MSFGGFSDGFSSNKSPAPMAEINVTPMVDVMLVLLVIFILTAPLMASSIKLDLPKTDAAKASEAPKFVTLVVDKSGQIFLDDKPESCEEQPKQTSFLARTKIQKFNHSQIFLFIFNRRCRYSHK